MFAYEMLVMAPGTEYVAMFGRLKWTRGVQRCGFPKTTLLHVANDNSLYCGRLLHSTDQQVIARSNPLVP